MAGNGPVTHPAAATEPSGNPSGSRPLRVLHVVSSLLARAGGPTVSVTGLCEALLRQGVEAEIATVGTPDIDLSRLRTPIHAFPLARPHVLRRSPELHRFLHEQVARFDLIHVHGLWEWPGAYARRAALAAGRPLVVSPRGMLEPWALQQGRFQKRLAWGLWEHANLRTASLLHATSPQEASGIRRLGLQSPVVVIPNGLEAPEPGPKPVLGRRRALFLSRLHPKKGVDLLLRAWASLEETHPDWELVIAGPGDPDYQKNLQDLARSLGLERLRFQGAVFDQAKWALIRSADLFVLPTHSENFGNVVLESLSQEVPVLTTRGTPWRDLETEGCGWWVDAEPVALAQALGGALGMSKEALGAMGLRGGAWVRKRFAWDGLAPDLLREYSTLAREAEER